VETRASPTKEVAGVVEKIVYGRHGPYAVASSDIGPITFSLAKEERVWQEEWPEPGDVVVLDVKMRRAGWRALEARFFRPGDELRFQKIPEKGEKR
jgi:hypothetical protein